MLQKCSSRKCGSRQCDIRVVAHTLLSCSPPALFYHSLAGNRICYDGNVEGLKALVAAIKQMPNLSSLEYASSRVPYPDSYPFRQVCGIGLWRSGLPFNLLCSHLLV
mgnify:CR=1 FL=1